MTEKSNAANTREVVEAAQAFVTSTSYFRQPKECREQFERLAYAVLALPDEDESDV